MCEDFAIYPVNLIFLCLTFCLTYGAVLFGLRTFYRSVYNDFIENGAHGKYTARIMLLIALLWISISILLGRLVKSLCS